MVPWRGEVAAGGLSFPGSNAEEQPEPMGGGRWSGRGSDRRITFRAGGSLTEGCTEGAAVGAGHGIGRRAAAGSSWRAMNAEGGGAEHSTAITLCWGFGHLATQTAPCRLRAPADATNSTQDGTSPLNIGLRSLQTFLPFINLCIYIAIAVFQKKWSVGPSFMTVLGLIFNVVGLVTGGLLRESRTFRRW